jgi:hypothetical protein
MRVLLGQIEIENTAASEQVLDENIADVSFMKPDGSIVTLKNTEGKY